MTLKQTLSDSSSLFHPEVHDQICIVSDSSSTTLIDHLDVQHTLTFAGSSARSGLTLADFAQTIEFVSQETKLLCMGGDCEFQSPSFTFMCMSTSTPRFPPLTSLANWWVQTSRRYRRFSI